MQQELVSGAATRILINGKVVGFATDVSIRRSQGVKVIHGIDIVAPQEIAVTGPYECSGSMNGFRVRSFGGHDGFGIVNASTLRDMFNQKYATIELLDRKTNVVYARVVGVIFDADSIQTTVKGVNTFSASFKGMWVYNETSDAKQ